MLNRHHCSPRSASPCQVIVKAAFIAPILLFVSACWQVHNDPACDSSPYTCQRSVSIFLPWEGEVRLLAAAVTYEGQRSVVKMHQITDPRQVPPVAVLLISLAAAAL